MLVPTLIMAVVACILSVVAWRTGGGKEIAGVKAAVQMTLQVLPLLIFAFLVAGLVQVLLPADLLSKWVGSQSGLRGILIGTVAGGLTPGGPYVSMPVVAGLLKAGASPGTMVAFLTSWSLWAVARLPLEIGILGGRFTAVRLLSTVFFPPVAGAIANALTRFIFR
jgi:uncharacterized membrane protein YraQ (UPF0718 family)